MDEVKVERRHREQAARAAFGKAWKDAAYAVDFVDNGIDSGGWSVTLGALARFDAEAEQRERAAERADVVAWLKTTPRACGVLVSLASSSDVARLADGIERGEHVRPPPEQID